MNRDIIAVDIAKQNLQVPIKNMLDVACSMLLDVPRNITMLSRHMSMLLWQKENPINVPLWQL